MEHGCLLRILSKSLIVLLPLYGSISKVMAISCGDSWTGQEYMANGYEQDED